MRGVISWNGTRSDTFGICLERYPNHVKPERKMERYTVPGRNGDIIMMENAWNNVDQEYSIFAGDLEKMSVHSTFTDIAAWLCAPVGYHELWDDFDPEHYRLAFFKGTIDVEALSLGRIGRTDITFDCKPQRYLIAGKAPVEFTNTPGRLYNPTAYQAKPLIFVERSQEGEGTVTVAGTVFTISSIPENGIYLDCEEMECYNGNKEAANNLVSSSTSEFAYLAPGNNQIGFTGAVSKVTITPKWFEI